MTRLSGGSYFGRTTSVRWLEDLLLTETAYDPDQRLPVHAHQRPYLCLVLTGQYEEVSDSGSVEASPFHVILHPPGSRHANRFRERGGRCFNIEMPAELLGRMLPDGGYRVFDLGGSVSRLAGELYGATRVGNRDAIRKGLGRLLDTLAADASAGFSSRGPRDGDGGEGPRPGGSATRGRPPAWLREARRRISQDASGDASMEEIAREVGVHPVHLSRAFRRFYGCTATSFRHVHRVRRSLRELGTEDDTVSAVAYRVGFSDESHLIRIFRRYVGITPGRYRRWVNS